MRAQLAERPLGTRARVPASRPASGPALGPANSTETSAAVASTALTMLTLVCLWTVLQLLVLGSLSHQRAQDVLYRELRTQLAGATAPVGPVVPVGEPVALLSIPAIGLEQVVVEGTASGDTLAGPGHRRDTPLPGQEGTSVVYGRAATYGAPFANLTELVPGDEIAVVAGQGRIRFQVLGVRRAGEPLPLPPDAGRARLTLVTAEGSGRLSALTPETTVYVDAEATKAFPAPAGRPTAVPLSETAMASDRGAMPLLALHLALLLALTLGVIAARQRWSPALVWVIASPLALALAWASTDVVMRLLPNLI